MEQSIRHGSRGLAQVCALRLAIRDRTVNGLLLQDSETVERRWWRTPGVRVWVVLVVALVGLGIAIWASEGPGPGDPGGHIMGQLRAVKGALPSLASVNYAQYVEPHQDSCDGNPATRGLSDVTLDINFQWPESPATLVDQVSRNLDSHGWSNRMVSLTPAGGSWEKRLTNGTTATAVLDHNGDGSWVLIADAPPVGKRVTGC